MRRPFVPLAAFAALVASTAVSCSSEQAEATYLQAQDLQAAQNDVSFDKNAVLDLPVLTDAAALDAAQVQQLLFRNPYKKTSFLATYQSNGVRAADAIVRAASRWRINPLVLVVKAQQDQGLVGERAYPAPASRVEYVFECGCSAPGHCDPALAGFDVQLECLARHLRRSLDEIQAGGQTASGWGPGVDSRTLDGDVVKPANAATAALYAQMPTVGVGKAGVWLFWNIFQHYASFVDYTGPLTPGGVGPTGWVGDPCTGPEACGYDGGVCFQSFPGGMCTAACSGGCPFVADRVAAFCAVVTGQTTAYCLPVCDAAAPGSCRDGYECRKATGPGGENFVCLVKQ